MVKSEEEYKSMKTTTLETPVNIIVGSHVWIEDPSVCWIDGNVSKINGQDVEIQTTNGNKTYTGNILIAINPFQRLPHIYDLHMMQQYKGAPLGELSPHVFAVADVAYRAMIHEGKSNSILVSGESGAGKTETTKMLMRYLAFLGGRAVTEGRTVEQQVLEEIEKYKLGHPKTFHYLNQSKCYELTDISDSREYLATRRAMDIVGISQKEQEAIFRVVAAILHIGNIDFAKGKEIDSSIPKDDKSKFHLKTTAELLMCDADGLLDTLCKRVMITPEEVIKRSLDPQSAAISRDGFAKIIYSRLFDWLVNKINNSIGQDSNSKSLIGVLDIYGFESFKTNRNPEESLLSLMKLGKILFSLDFLPFNGWSMFPKSTHETFANKLYQTFKNHKRFIKPKLSRTDFTISHYAGELQLQQLMETLNSTEPHYIRCVKPNHVLKPAIFENVNIMQQLRCGVSILWLMGVLEAIRISCAGYPTRKPFFEFINRFTLLAPEVTEADEDEKTVCKKILENMGLKGYQIGKTKVFLRAGQMAELDARRAQVLSNAAKTIQRRIRTHHARKHYLALRKKTVYVQSLWRGRLACKLYENMRREDAVVKIQKTVRRYEARKAYNKLQASVLALQTASRAIASFKEFIFRKRNKASTIVQARWRCHKAASYYKRLKKGSVVTQCRWRGRLARRELRKLKMAARDTGALKELKDKLEKRVEELTWRLQLEKSLRTNLEESKAQEISKLQNSLQEVQSKADETNAMLIKERENSKKLIEETPPVIKETQVIVEDTQKIESLTVEVESLKNSLESERHKSDDLERKYNEAQAYGEDRSKKLEDTEKKVRQLQESLTRLEEKITNLESENQVLRQQAVSMAPTKFLSGRSRSIMQRVDSGHIGMEARIPLSQDNNDVLAYWLSNASTLLLLLQRTLKASGAAGMAPQRRRSSSGTLFGRMTNSFRGAPPGVNISIINGSMNGGVDTIRQVEAKYPALLFKQQLTAYVEKIYGMIRDNLKKEISPLLGLCIQAPRTSRASLVKGASRSVASTEAQKALIAHWQGIVKSLGIFLSTLKENHVPPFLVRKVFTQIFSFINVQLFNSLLLRRECCSFSNGEFVKAGLAELENWCFNATDEYAGSAWDELKHIRQAIGFLVIHQKPKKTLNEISHDLCPVLSIQQLYRISTMYWDDKYGTHSVSPDVISNMRVLMTEDSNNAVSNSFLLDDDSSIPFSVDDISKSMEQIDISDVEPPALIRDNFGFSFLMPTSDGQLPLQH
ncbi:unnamed protein product [Lupinus luteus]|uniref:Uncharacterized protein n=1 Tax=Lupinus luteus TaxID=3873 RepID=A0AAV1WI59_LUPLU